MGLLRADSGFFDEAILTALEPGLELTELRYRAIGWERERRLIVVRQSAKRKTAPGKTLSLFADDPDI